jgi:hypothetical protein
LKKKRLERKLYHIILPINARAKLHQRIERTQAPNRRLASAADEYGAGRSIDDLEVARDVGPDAVL